MRRFGVPALKVGVTVLVTWFIFDRVGVDLSRLRTLDAESLRPRPVLLVSSGLVLAAGYLWSAAVWGRLVHDLGGPRLPVWTSIRIFMVANLGRYVPGKVWQIAGLAYLAKRDGVPAGVATGAAVVGQGIALLGASLVGLGVLLGTDGIFAPLGSGGRVVGMGVGLALVWVVVVPGLFRRVVALWFRILRIAPPQEGLGRGNVGLRWLMLYLLNWGIYALAFWLLYLSFEEWQPFVRVGPAFAAAYVAGYVAIFAPAGAGIREGVLVVLLQPIMARESAVVLALIARVWTTAVELIPAAVLAVAGARSLGSGGEGE